MESILQIVKQVGPETPRPYRVLETYMTSEGPRSRICSGTFCTMEDAESWRDQLQAAGKPAAGEGK